MGIYNGSINRWNDRNILKHNKKNTFPNEEIRPCARFEKSGSTFVFTSALSAFDAAWKQTYGVFKNKEEWPEAVKVVFVACINVLFELFVRVYNICCLHVLFMDVYLFVAYNIC